MQQSHLTTYSVNLWGSHPDNENDDCHTGADFTTRQSAERAVAILLEREKCDDKFLQENKGLFSSLEHSEFIELTGPDMPRQLIKNPFFIPRRDSFDLERSEAQMQAAMAFGVQGWNDYEGQ